MIADADAVRLCAEIYSSPETSWERYFDGDEPSGICAAVHDDVLIFRGSVTQEDWFRDLQAQPTRHPKLGGVDFGFMEGLDGFYTKIVDSLSLRTVVCGHSLGAARALLFGALLAADGRPPAAIITFGSPRPGFSQLAEILKPVPIRSYKNRFDPVTDVPVPFYPDLPYVHPRALLPLNVKPPLADCSIFADHHIELYEQGIIGGSP